MPSSSGSNGLFDPADETVDCSRTSAESALSVCVVAGTWTQGYKTSNVADKDFYSLIVNIWHCRSPVSVVADLQKVCLGRWDVTKDWTPWNCVLLTIDEMRAHNEVKDIKEDKDFYSLIVNIWHCRSPVSGVADLQKVCLGRWDVTKDWTPWNCVLLTIDEMRAHNEVKDIKEVYAPDFIAHVRLKHRLAELQFSHLYQFDKHYAGSGKSCAVKDTKH